jgi:hypothetical protein
MLRPASRKLLAALGGFLNQASHQLLLYPFLAPPQQTLALPLSTVEADEKTVQGLP